MTLHQTTFRLNIFLALFCSALGAFVLFCVASFYIVDALDPAISTIGYGVTIGLYICSLLVIMNMEKRLTRWLMSLVLVVAIALPMVGAHYYALNQGPVVKKKTAVERLSQQN